MKIDLEKYIRSNRSDLDDIEPIDIDQMWSDFDERERLKQKDQKPVRRLRAYLLYTAAAIGVLLIGAQVLLNDQKLNKDDLVYQKLIEINPELAAEQVAMIQIINQQDSLIKQIGISESQFPELFREMENLDSLQMEVIEDLDNYRDRKNLTRTLLRHYQRKARILELMMHEFDNQEKESNYEYDKQI